MGITRFSDQCKNFSQWPFELTNPKAFIHSRSRVNMDIGLILRWFVRFIK
jgi:hypothetical protein